MSESDSWMQHAIWVGGASASGKTTITDRIGDQAALNVIHLDDWLNEILESSESKSMPAMNWYRTVGAGRWFASSTIEDCERYIAALREQMESSISKLSTMVKSPTLIEGSCFFPDMAQRLSPAGRHVWVVGTDGFREQMYRDRGWVHDLTSQYKNPDFAWQNWMIRDAYQAEYVRKSTTAHDLNWIENDGGKSVDEVSNRVAESLGVDLQ